MLKNLKGIKSATQHIAPIQKLSRLCHVCNALRAQSEILREQKSLYEAKFQLGPLRGIHERYTTCALCRLIITAIIGGRPQDGEQTIWELDPACEVELRWQSEKEFMIGVQSEEWRIMLMGDDELEIARKTGTVDHHNGNELSKDLPLARGRIPSTRPTDLDQMRNWLANCRRHHGTSCNRSGDEIQDWFHYNNPKFCRTTARLIDVRSYCIVDSYSIPRGSDNDFIALSYIWGGVSLLRLTSGNIDKLMQVNSLKRLWRFLPRTIQDAITLTRSFRVPYLWVDALCLIQNSKYDLQMGIEDMYMIYEHALFTIIAAAGSDANADLPGVRPGTRDLMQQSEDLGDGVKAFIIRSLDSQLARSKYITRAWTLPEQVGSPRQLVFTADAGVFFKCAQAEWSLFTVDDEYPSIDASRLNKLSQAFEPSDEDLADSYVTVMEEYTGRNLTNSADILNAFNTLEFFLRKVLPGRFKQGLPAIAFDCFILFEGHGAVLERRAGFPSWSWAGWKGKVGSLVPRALRTTSFLEDWLKRRTWIVWYYRRRWHPPTPIWHLEDNTKMCGPDEDWDSWEGFSFRDHGCPSDIDPSETEPTENITLPLKRRTSHLLQFWTLSIHLTMARILTGNGEIEILDRALLLDNDDEFAGSVALDGHYFTEKDYRKPVEIILLSEATYEVPNFEGYQPRVYSDDDTDIYEGSVTRRDEDYDLYWAMLIRRDEDGMVAERRGLGQILKTSVAKSVAPGPAWKEILLA